MGADVLTLADLIPDAPKAVIVGINPAPPSVAVGHYYQGTQGQRLFARLRQVGVLPTAAGWEDDAGYAAGLGFTDIVKRPSRSADDIDRDELKHGERLLRDRLSAAGASWVIFAFKKAATSLFGSFEGNGHMPGLHVGESNVFVMPGPYESASSTADRLNELRQLLQ